jgi:hypothetical protein
MLKVVFLSLPKEPVLDSTLDCKSHGVCELKLLFNMMLRLHVPIFR